MAKMTAAVMEEKIKTEFSQPKLVGESPGFEIYFHVLLPQDLVWLPMEYCGCPSQPLSPAQSKKVKL